MLSTKCLVIHIVRCERFKPLFCSWSSLHQQQFYHSFNTANSTSILRKMMLWRLPMISGAKSTAIGVIFWLDFALGDVFECDKKCKYCARKQEGQCRNKNHICQQFLKQFHRINLTSAKQYSFLSIALPPYTYFCCL